jgi:phosphoribosylamine--glycine ligase
MIACATGSLDDVAPVEWSDRPVVAIVMVSGGYPGSYETGFEIDGLDGSELDSEEGIVFHAGVRRDGDGSGKLLTSGGRVLACVGTGDSIEEARDRAYRHTAGVSFKGAYYRRDIAQLSLGQPTTVR